MRFKITYKDPDTEELVSVYKEFEDSHEPHFISAADWAEDYAYAKADKGFYVITTAPEE